jgi:hypothetical protein
MCLKVQLNFTVDIQIYTFLRYLERKERKRERDRHRGRDRAREKGERRRE